MSPPPPKPHSKNRVEQQNLAHIYIRHSPLSVAVVFLILALAAIPIGVVVLICGDRTIRLTYRYDNVNNYSYTMGAAGVNAYDFPFNGSTYSTGVTTKVKFTLERSIMAPVYIQYRLNPFYQNYRWFAASVDVVQLRGGTHAAPNVCKPYRYPGEATDEEVSGFYNPCGAYPWSLFNDSISLYKEDGSLICNGGAFTAKGTSLVSGNLCVKSGIALKKDVNDGYREPKAMADHGPMWAAGGNATATDPYEREGYYYREPGHSIPSSLDEDLMVWLNMAYMPQVANTYRIINTDLPAGEYYFEITELFATAPYQTRKYVELSTRSWIGGRNHLLGILLIVMGSVAFVMAVALLCLQCCITPRYAQYGVSSLC